MSKYLDACGVAISSGRDTAPCVSAALECAERGRVAILFVDRGLFADGALLVEVQARFVVTRR